MTDPTDDIRACLLDYRTAMNRAHYAYYDAVEDASDIYADTLGGFLHTGSKVSLATVRAHRQLVNDVGKACEDALVLARVRMDVATKDAHNVYWRVTHEYLVST